MLDQLPYNADIFLKVGYTIPIGNSEIYTSLQELRILELKRNQLYKCVNSDDFDYHILDKDQFSCTGNMYEIEPDLLECEQCGRNVDRGSKHVIEEFYEISSVNYGKIQNLLQSIIKKLPDCKYNKKERGKNEWLVNFKGKEIRIVLVDTIQSDDYLYQYEFLHTKIVFIGFHSSFTNIVGVINGFDILKGEINHFQTAIISKATEQKTLKQMEYSNLEAEISKLLGDQDWGFFEKSFSNKFFKILTESNEPLIEYLSYLDHNRNNIKGGIIFNVGGSSKTDIRIKSKFDYLEPLFNSQINVDPKCYAASKLTKGEYDTVVSQMMSDIHKPKAAIILSLATQVTADVWSESDTFNLINQVIGRKVIIIPRYLLLEIISASGKSVEIISLIDGYLKSKV